MTSLSGVFVGLLGGIAIGGVVMFFAGKQRVASWRNLAEHFEREAKRLAKVAADEQFRNRHYVRVENVVWTNVNEFTGHATYEGES